MQPQAVIFDIGNVLIEWNPERYYDARIGAAARQRLFAEVDLHAMNMAVDSGGPFRETIYETAERYPGWAEQIRWWHDDWIDIAAPAIDRSVALMRALRASGVPVFALTNFGVESFAYAQTHYDFLHEFDRAFVSGQMRVVKPDPEIYRMVEAGCGVPADRLLFTDDRGDNIAAAAARGWQVHLFDGPDALARRLVADGLLTETEAGL